MIYILCDNDEVWSNRFFHQMIVAVNSIVYPYLLVFRRFLFKLAFNLKFPSETFQTFAISKDHSRIVLFKVLGFNQLPPISLLEDSPHVIAIMPVLIDIKFVKLLELWVILLFLFCLSDHFFHMCCCFLVHLSAKKL